MAKAGFIGGVGAWVLALGFSFGSSAWPEYIKPHPHWVIALLAVGGLMMLVPVVQRFYPIFKDKESTSLNLDLVIEAIVRTRTGGPLGRWQHADIFVQVSAHLHAPHSAMIDYKLDLIRNGVTTQSCLIGDTGLWQFANRKRLDDAAARMTTGGLFQDAQRLDSSLSITGKSDGWLHFQIADKSDLEITESRLRLTGTSPSAPGMACVERDLTGTMTSPLIFVKKVYSQA